MLRRVMKTLLICLVVVLLLVAAGAYLVSSSDWARDQLRAVIAQELANRSGREVQVGAIEGDLLSGVVVNNLAIAAESKLKDGVALAAEYIRVDYDLFAVLRGKPPLACIQRVEIGRAYANVIRDEAGVINLTQIFPPPTPPVVVPPEQRFRGQILIHDSVVDYRDEAAPTRDGRPLELSLADVQGEVLVSQYGSIKASLVATGAEERLAALGLDINADTETKAFALDGTLSGVDAPWWYHQFVHSPDFTLTGGRLRGRFTIWSGTEPDGAGGLDYYACAEITDGAAHVAALGGPVRFDGRVSLTPEGMAVEALSAQWSGAVVQARGSVFDWSSLGLDLSVQVRNLPPKPLLALLPRETRPSLDMLQSAGRINADLQVVGAVPDLTVNLTAHSAEEFRLAREDDIHLTLSGIEVQAAIPNVSELAVAARVSVENISAAPLIIPMRSGDEIINHALCIRDLHNVSAELLYAGGTPVLETTLAVEQVTVDDLPISALAASVQVVGRTVRISGVRAEVAGGELVGQGLVQLDESGEPTVQFDLAARDLELADLSRVRGAEVADLSGQANLLLVGRIEGGQPAIVGRARASQIEFEGKTVEEAVALVEWRGEDIHVPVVQIRDPKGLAWVQGTVSPGGEFDLRLTAAELDLAAWGRQFNQSDLTGVGYLRAHLLGTFDEPAGSVQLVAFNAGHRDITVDALYGEFSLAQSALDVEELLAARGPTMLEASGRLAGIAGGSPQMPIAADLKIVGVQLREVSDLADLARPLSGVAEIEAKLSGTLDEPEITAQVAIPYGSFDLYPITDMKFAVAADHNEVRVTQGSLKVAEADVTLQGQATKWVEFLEDRSVALDYSARLSIENADLQAIISPEETDVLIEGHVDLPLVEIHSTPDGPAGKAHLLVPHLVVGGQSVSAIDTMVLMESGQVSLQDTTLQVGSAQIQAGASYSWERKQGSAKVSLTDGRIEELLGLAAPVSKLVAEDTTEEDISRRLRSLSLRSRGALTLAVELRGSPADFTAQVQTTATDLSFDRKYLPALAGEFTVDVAGGELVAVRDILAEVTQGDGLLIIEGDVSPDGELALLADGTNFSLSLWREWLPEEISLGGTVSMMIVATGSTHSPSLKGSVDVSNPVFQGISFDLASIPILSLDQSGLDIDVLLLKRGEQEINLHGELPVRLRPLGLDPDGQIELSGKIENTDLSFFPPLLDEFFRSRVGDGKVAKATIWSQLRTRGQMDSEVTITGKLREPVILGYLRVSDAKVAMPGWSPGLDNVQVDMEFARQEGQNILDILAATARWDNTVVTLSGHAALSHFSPEQFAQNEFDLAIDVDSPAQRLFGETVVSNLTGRVLLTSQPDLAHLLTIEEIRGNLGRGTLEVSGYARLANTTLAGLARNEADIQLSLTDAAIKYAPVYDGLLSGVIAIANPEPEQPIAVVGHLVAHHARVAPPAPSAGGGGPVYGWGPQRPAPRFDVEVEIGPEVVLKTPGLTAPLQRTDVQPAYAAHITGTPQDPLIAGRVELKPGRATVSAGSVRITQFGVEYRYGPKLGEYQPPRALALSGRIWGSAEQIIPAAVVNGRPIEQLHIFIEIEGGLPEPINLTLDSDPPLSEDQLYQIMGTAPLGLVGGPGKANLTSLLSQQFTGLVAAAFRSTIFRPIEEQIKQTLGLDQFTVVFGFDQPVDVRIGKHVTKHLLVNYRHTVVSDLEDEWDLSLSYELPRKFRVTFTADEKGDEQFQVGYIRQF